MTRQIAYNTYTVGKIKTKFYPVYVGEGLLESFDFNEFGASAYVIVCDQTVRKKVASHLASNPSLRTAPLHEVVVPPGESSKTMTKAEKILRFMAANNLDRYALVIALGGGVIGDLAGFVASVYKRGVSYVQLPTTLLAQADSAHGGKTALNIPEGKNLIGSTYFPKAVIADIGILKSLPDEELSSGLAEVIKHGVVWDAKLFNYLEKHISKLSMKETKHLVEKSAIAKAKITEKDPNELEFRKILNYGHTVGHALEIASGHNLNHGQAVALGMACEGHIANKLGFFNSKDLARQNNLIKELDIHVKQSFKTDELIEYMRRDKKSKAGKLYFVMPLSIGKVRQEKGQVAFEVEEQVVRECLKLLS